MVCGRCVSSIFVRAGILNRRLRLSFVGKGLLPRVDPQLAVYFPNRVFKRYLGMMVDTGSMSTRAGPSMDTASQKDDDSARSGFVTGGWKRNICVNDSTR
ncbi:unnamed protein product [Lathyrus oleraceus]|uniref:Uncharacterized protein n=1 Tax=Pisum sativum TaxID=3888 RepID=A0A9D4WS25_PEA|nr:hypothetical protein KIW84_052419 [Pisum sativum]